ncbi:MAG TPA: helicase, partial [Microbacterium sp.]|nr:helicase [Microbacterium sp.]
ADAASGAAVGSPCERAEQVAGATGAVLVACDLDALTATVRVSVGAGPFAAEARARAGPPPSSAP